jgi:hypothetical protein
MERIKLYEPGTTFDLSTLNEVRQERERVGVVRFEVLTLGAITGRKIDISGVISDDSTVAEVLKFSHSALRKSGALYMASEVDYDGPVFRSKMARKKSVVIVDMNGFADEGIKGNHGGRFTLDHLEVAAEKNAGSFLVDLLVLPRGIGGQVGGYRVEVITGIFTGEGRNWRGGSLLREFFDDEVNQKYGMIDEYVPFLMLPPDMKMGRLPISRNIEEYWMNQAYLMIVMVPKSLV